MALVLHSLAGMPSSTNELAEVMRARAPGSARWPADVAPALAAKLLMALDHAREAWPALELPDLAVVEHLADRLPETTDPLVALAQLEVDELVLCLAVARGDRKALELFEQHYLRPAQRGLVRLRLDASAASEVLQQFRIRLFMGDEGGAPRILQYSGAGALAGWVRIGLTRAGLSAMRTRRRADKHADALAIAEVTDCADDPEMTVLRARFRECFDGCVRQAFEALSAQERNVLRFYVIDGLSIDEIGSLQRQDRSTVARQIARIRCQVREATRVRLMSEAAVSQSECDSIVRGLVSGLYVSIARLLLDPRQVP